MNKKKVMISQAIFDCCPSVDSCLQIHKVGVFLLIGISSKVLYD